MHSEEQIYLYLVYKCKSEYKKLHKLSQSIGKFEYVLSDCVWSFLYYVYSFLDEAINQR